MNPNLYIIIQATADHALGYELAIYNWVYATISQDLQTWVMGSNIINDDCHLPVEDVSSEYPELGVLTVAVVPGLDLDRG